MENYLWKGFFVSQIARGSAANRATIGIAAMGLNYVADCANWTREDTTKEVLKIMKEGVKTKESAYVCTSLVAFRNIG